MSVVVCVQPKVHPRIEEAKRSQEARSWFSFVFRLKKEQTSAAVRVKVPVLVLLRSVHSNDATRHKLVSECPRLVRELVYY